MKIKTRGTIILICGIVSILFSALFIVLNLAFDIKVNESGGIVTDILFIIFGIYFCFLGVRIRNKDK